MKKTIHTLGLLVGLSLSVSAQDNAIDHVLQSIEENNIQLKAAREEKKALTLETCSENNLEDPSVAYSYLYNSENSGVQQSELTVVQSVDFPTTYAARKKSNRLQAENFQQQYEILRRETLLQARLLCIDLIALNQQNEVLKTLTTHADSLVELYEKRVSLGEANILELNRIKMERMALLTAQADNDASHRSALQNLLAMNGNKPITFEATRYPNLQELPPYETLRSELLPINREVLQSQAEKKVASKQLSVHRMGWLPKLEIGYRRNTSPGEEFNGFIVGGSLPIFSNKNKVKAARARELSAELKEQEIALQIEASLQSRYNEAQQLRKAMEGYDLKLIEETYTLLGKALLNGELSLPEYYIETNAVVQQKKSYIELENRYQRLIAEIYADKDLTSIDY